MIRLLTFQIILHNRHNNFSALGLLVKGTKDKENKEKTKKQTQHPSSCSYLNKGTKNLRQKKSKSTRKKTKTIR